jgi:hypothetical protein
MRYFNDAIAKDPSYGPVYENLYQLLYTTDVTKSAENLEKFLANTDEDPKNCYYRASMKYAQALFNDAITLADGCIKSSPNPYSKLYGIKAYSYNKLGDSVNAKEQFEKYFSVADPATIGTGDYSTYASVLLKFPGNDSIAGTYVDKAVLLDTLEVNKVNYIKSMAGYYDGQKRYKDAADWYSKLVALKKNPSKTDIYNGGYNYFRSGNYERSIILFDIYSAKYPEDAFSYYMKGKAYWAIDSTMEMGLANKSFEKTIEVSQADRVKYKSQLIGSYKYFVAYMANIKKDKAGAVAYCDSVLAIDPADAEAANNKTIISNMNMNAPAPKQAKPAPNNGSANKPNKQPGAKM